MSNTTVSNGFRTLIRSIGKHEKPDVRKEKQRAMLEMFRLVAMGRIPLELIQALANPSVGLDWRAKFYQILHKAELTLTPQEIDLLEQGTYTVAEDYSWDSDLVTECKRLYPGGVTELLQFFQGWEEPMLNAIHICRFNYGDNWSMWLNHLRKYNLKPGSLLTINSCIRDRGYVVPRESGLIVGGTEYYDPYYATSCILAVGYDRSGNLELIHAPYKQQKYDHRVSWILVRPSTRSCEEALLQDDLKIPGVEIRTQMFPKPDLGAML